MDLSAWRYGMGGTCWEEAWHRLFVALRGAASPVVPRGRTHAGLPTGLKAEPKVQGKHLSQTRDFRESLVSVHSGTILYTRKPRLQPAASLRLTEADPGPAGGRQLPRQLLPAPV